MLASVAARRSTLPVVALSVLLAGCGSVGERQDAASAVAVGLLEAVAAGDGRAACDRLAPDTVDALEDAAGVPCARAILAEDLPPPGGVVGAEVFGQWAQVKVDGDTVFLAVFPDGWLVVAAGCTSRDPRPYQCQLDGG
jgi:hypothetical protein